MLEKAPHLNYFKFDFSGKFVVWILVLWIIKNPFTNQAIMVIPDFGHPLIVLLE